MNKKILILDDEQGYIDALRNFLAELGYDIIATVSPTEALKIISDKKPDIVLFDYKLPEMDGDIFYNKAKNLCRDIIFVLVTAYRDNEAINKLKKMGIRDIIFKPIDLNVLLEIIG